MNTTKSRVPDIDKYCRLCAMKTTTRNRLNIFQGDDHHADIALKIATCLPVVVAENDLLPNSVCINCANKLDAFYEFRETSLSSESFFYDLVDKHNNMQRKIYNVNVKQAVSNRNTYTRPLPEFSNVRRVKQPSEYVSCVMEDADSDIIDQQSSGFDFGQFANTLIDIQSKDITQGQKKTTQKVNFSTSLLKSSPQKTPPIHSVSLLKKTTNTENTTSLNVFQNTFCSSTSPSYSNENCAKIISVDDPSSAIKTQSESSPETVCTKGEFISRSILQAKSLIEKCQNVDQPTGETSDSATALCTESLTSILQCPQCHVFFLPAADVSHVCEPINVKEDTPLLYRNPEKSKIFTCTQCGKDFPKKERLVIHMRQHTGERPYKCSHCDKSYTSKTSLRAHNEEIHEKKWKYVCSYCGRGYVCKNKFECHVRKQHTGERPFQCNYCERSFFRKHDWLEHEEIYHCESPQQHKCEICGKTFKCSKYLIIHKKIHKTSLEERKKFKCNFCDVSHTSKRSLQRHILSHTGELPFECEKCNKRFRGKDGLKIHLMIHAGLKQFVCDVCGKAFVQKNTLDCHIRTHTGEHPYQCDICKRCFTQRSSLTCHRKRHNRHSEYAS